LSLHDALPISSRIFIPSSEQAANECVKRKRITWSPVDRCSVEAKFEVAGGLEADFLAMNEWLRRERLTELPENTRWIFYKFLSFQLAKEELRPHRSQPPKKARQLQRSSTVNSKHVDRWRIVAECHRAAVARSP